MNKPRTLIIGWDGATFDVIKPLVAKGRLPHIASLMKNGIWGRLESTTPPLTPVAWTSISTGVNPGKHGIFDAMSNISERHKICFVNASMRKTKPLWSILSERDRKVGVMNVPVTYPTDNVNGFMISGMFTPDGVTDFIFPQDVRQEIEEKFGKYQIECKIVEDNPSAYLKSILKMIDFREKVALYLMERYQLDFFFVTFIASDRVQHFYWKYLDPSHPLHGKYGDAIALVYERLDRALGRLLEKTGTDTHVIMVSDHGAGPLKSAFFLNNWLMRNGYLYLKENPTVSLRFKKKFPGRSGFVKLMKKAIPSGILEKIKPHISGVKGKEANPELNTFFSLIDWEKTVAFSEGGAGGIYINNHSNVKTEGGEEVLDRLIRGLCEITDHNGERVIKAVHRREELYCGDYAIKSPDLTVVCNDGYQIITPNEVLFFYKEYEDNLFLPHRWSGRHEPYGIFLLSGPAVKKDMELKDVRIIDIAPTILYLMNEAIPRYMDGKVLDLAIDHEHILKNPARYTDDIMLQEGNEMSLTEEEEEKIAERLKSLGYIE